MRFNGTLIYDYVYVVMFDYVVQVGELLKILCVELHNQCDNAINQCYFIFALWSIMGLDTYYCLIFYGLTLIHLTDPLTQVVQIMYVCIFIYISANERVLSFFLVERTRTLESTHLD